jgi:hypothetical protein
MYNESMKVCKGCGLTKHPDQYNKHPTTKDRLDPRCKECRCLYARGRYHETRDAHRVQSKLSRERFAEIIREKKRVPCADCGGTFHFAAMDFDHIDGTDKRFNVSQLRSRGSIRLLEAEIAKCEVVCANCHRVRTYNRKMAELSQVG